MSDVEILVNSALNAVTTEDWAKCGEHCNEIQEDDLIKEGLRVEILEPLLSQLILTIVLLMKTMMKMIKKLYFMYYLY
jgi:hypothetical protein